MRMKTITMQLLVLFAALMSSTVAQDFSGFVRLGPVPQSEGPSVRAAASYFLSTTATSTWSGALNMCAALGGTLAAPKNPVENQALRFYLTQHNFNAHLWIGGRKLVSGPWQWESSVNVIPMLWTNWQTPQCASTSGEVCAFVYGSGMDGWCSKACSGTTYFVCEA